MYPARSSAASALLLLAACPALLCSCSGGAGTESSTPAQPPVIVVQAPPETTTTGTSGDYAGLAWQTPTSDATPPAPEPAVADASPDAEPYDVVALLREFDPQLTDAPKDQSSTAPTDDLLSAFAVMDDKYLYGRIVTRAPMSVDASQETRFWIEQEGKMVTVEVKVGTRDRPCELSDVTSPDDQKVVSRCFWTGNALDFRMPLEAVPPVIDTTKPYWVSGFQTCCADAERNKPFDELEGAQEVWRVPGLAAEVETKGDDASD